VVSEAGGANPHQPSPKGTAQSRINPIIKEHHFLGAGAEIDFTGPGLVKV
jgi:hypothetical protein